MGLATTNKDLPAFILASAIGQGMGGDCGAVVRDGWPQRWWEEDVNFKFANSLCAVLMAIWCTIATAAAPNALSLSRSFILRPPLLPPPSVASRSLATMNNHQNNTTGAATDIDAIFKQKRAVRSRVKKELKNMDPTLRSHEDKAIQNIISEAPWFKTCKRLCAYISCSALREVDTSNILSEILQNPPKDGHPLMGKKLYVPRVEDRNRNMRMLNISSIDDLVANSMNILEPAPVDAEGNERENVMKANDPVDLLLLPGLAFDKSGRRLGRGGGSPPTMARLLTPPSHHPWPIGAPVRPVEGHRAKRKPFELKSTLIGVESSLVRSVSKQISHSHSPYRRLTVGSAFPTRSGRVSDEIGARFRRASEKEAPIRGSQGDSPPLCKISCN
ncbi:5-formyltetrahydrofolate cycloligase [Actinidia rufa]|uniref:5-formyltetrahydrofolate cyclo-ligase n=1 Tax=Actinidia rufa TaxID=165716 RepID=A0A7J0DCZ0_9ERIC|nr:5-formyltetrahydrofolate cycloligase [Actinidia rufa]